MYNLRQLFKQEPAIVSAAILNVLGVLILVDVINMSNEAMAGIGMALTTVLALFYVRAQTTTKDYLSQIGHPLPAIKDHAINHAHGDRGIAESTLALVVAVVALVLVLTVIF